MSNRNDLDRNQNDDEEQEERQDRQDRQGRQGRQDSYQDRGDRSMRRRRGRRRKEDYFRANELVPDYKDVDTLRRFLTDRAKIRPRRQTGLTSKNQRLLARQIKRARHLALLPFTDEHMRG